MITVKIWITGPRHNSAQQNAARCIFRVAYDYACLRVAAGTTRPHSLQTTTLNLGCRKINWRIASSDVKMRRERVLRELWIRGDQGKQNALPSAFPKLLI